MADDSLAQLVAQLPKAELHVHLEGTITPQTVIRLADRNDITLPWSSLAELTDAYDFADLPDFLEILWAAARTMRTGDDLYDVTIAYLERAVQDHVIRVEPFFGAQTFLDAGMPIATMMDAVLRAFDDARTQWGIDAQLICSAQRHRDETSALELLELLDPWRDRILGVGLGGAERGNPPSKFARYFTEARRRGYRLSIHAGEDGPSAYIADALDSCRAERIDHGTALIEDPALITRVRDEGIPLTMCPLSNLALHVVPSLTEHPLARLLHEGVLVTVNSDDPPFFGGFVNDNYVAVATALQLTRNDVIALARNSFRGSFADPDEQDRLIALVDAAAESAEDRSGSR